MLNMTFKITKWWFDCNDLDKINSDDFFKMHNWEKLIFDLDEFLQNTKKEIVNIPNFINDILNNDIYKESIIWLKPNIQKYISQKWISKKYIQNEIITISKNIKSQDINNIMEKIQSNIVNSIDEIIYIWSLPFKKIHILIYIYVCMTIWQINFTSEIDQDKKEIVTKNTKKEISKELNKKETVLWSGGWSKIIVWKKTININKRENSNYALYCARISRQLLQAMWIKPPQENRSESFNNNYESADALANHEALCLWKNPKLLQKFKDSNPWFWISTNQINTNSKNDTKKKFNLKKLKSEFRLKWEIIKSNWSSFYKSSEWSEHKIYSYDDIYREISENENISNNANNAFLMRTLQNNMKVDDWHQLIIAKIQNILNWTYEYYAIDPLLNHNFWFKWWKADDPNMIPLKDYIKFCNSKWRYILWIMWVWWKKIYNSDQIATIKKYNENIKDISKENMDNFENSYTSWLEKFIEVLNKRWIDKDSILKDINMQDIKAHIFTESSLKSNNHRKNWAWWYWQLEPGAYVDIKNYIE